jgi:hypothetical protein
MKGLSILCVFAGDCSPQLRFSEYSNRAICGGEIQHSRATPVEPMKRPSGAQILVFDLLSFGACGLSVGFAAWFF